VKLGLGLIARSPQWEQLLKQEGVPFSYVDLSKMKEECSLLVVNRALDNSEQRAVEAYLQDGGAMLAYSAYVHGVCGTTTRQERVDYLLADHDRIFPTVHLVDLATLGEIPREANCLKTQLNTFGVFAGPLGGGYAVLLPFDPALAITDMRAANKSFYSLRERLPSERVSLVAKGEMSRLLHEAFTYLHHQRGLPYAHLWYYPHGKENLFAFRIDSDKGSRAEVDDLFATARDNDVRMSWFLDVKSHEEWLQHFAFLSGQELGVHCYEHRTYDTYEENLKNIQRARHKLDQAGISSPGFTAPFGIWNTSLAKAIDKAGFEYSSEFSFVYDAFPVFPSERDFTFEALQVPIHPICIGSLRRVGYTEAQMTEYFAATIGQKLLRHEPLFFYHHPTHRCWDVVRFIFKYMKGKGIANTTMLEYARWWKKRANCDLTITHQQEGLSIHSSRMVDESVWLRIVDPMRKVAIVPIAERMMFNQLDWSPEVVDAFPPSDIRRTREFNPREMLGGIITSLNRKFSEGNSKL
jgi:hypothetical protein